MSDDLVIIPEGQFTITTSLTDENGISFIETFIPIKVKKLEEDAIIPTNNRGDAGWDLYYTGETIEIEPGARKTLSTSLSFAIPDGMVGLIWPRSGLAVKHGIDVLAGVVDSSYRGEIKVCLYNTGREYYEVNRGDRIAQILFQEVPHCNLIVTDELDKTDRNQGGFGSTGK